MLTLGSLCSVVIFAYFALGYFVEVESAMVRYDEVSSVCSVAFVLVSDLVILFIERV